jgi:hypothetical protein
MQRLIKSLFKDNLFIIAIGITISIAYLCLMKMPEGGVSSFGNIDKLYHTTAYFTLSILWLFSFYKKPNLKYIIISLCIVYGIIIEVLQATVTTYRSGDFKDILANTLGVCLGLLVFNIIFKKN